MFESYEKKYVPNLCYVTSMYKYNKNCIRLF